MKLTPILFSSREGTSRVRERVLRGTLAVSLSYSTCNLYSSTSILLYTYLALDCVKNLRNRWYHSAFFSFCLLPSFLPSVLPSFRDLGHSSCNKFHRNYVEEEVFHLVLREYPSLTGLRIFWWSIYLAVRWNKLWLTSSGGNGIPRFFPLYFLNYKERV